MLFIILSIGDINIGGFFFGDYYYINSTSSSDTLLKDSSGFWIRRIYFNISKASNIYEALLRLEMNDPGLTKSGFLTPYVKDVYISFKLYQNHKLVFGIQSSNAFEFIEKRWAFRFIQKTATDLYQFAPAREYGIGLSGNLNKFEYNFTSGNGKGIQSEDDKFKKYGFSLKYIPIKQLAFEIYGDYYENGTTTIQGFISYNHELFDVGIVYSNQQKPSDTISFLSTYLTTRAIKNVSTILRYDRVFKKISVSEPYLNIDKNSAFSYILVGLSYKVFDNFYVAPVFDLIIYDDENINSERMFRCVFFYKF